MNNNYYYKYLKYKKKYLALKGGETQLILDDRIGKSFAHLNLSSKANSVLDDRIRKLFAQHKAFPSVGDKTRDNFQNNGYAMTYGELTIEGFNTILDFLKEKKMKNSMSLVDLGSGMGKVPIMAAHYGKAEKAMGIELAKERHDIAEKMLKELPELKDKLKFINGDMFKYDVSDYNVVYISNLCFSEEINQRLSEKLQKELPTGAFIFASKKLNGPKIDYLGSIKVKMTWANESNLHCFRIK